MWTTARSKHCQLQRTRHSKPIQGPRAQGPSNHALITCTLHAHWLLWAVPPFVIGQTFPALALNLLYVYILWHTNQWTFEERSRQNINKRWKKNPSFIQFHLQGHHCRIPRLVLQFSLEIFLVSLVVNARYWSLFHQTWQREMVGQACLIC